MIRMLLEDIFHKFNFFLNTPSGSLFQNAVVLLLLIIVSIFIILEYRRSRDTDLKFLLIAFGLLLLQKLILVVVLAYYVFGNVLFTLPYYFAPMLGEGLELVFLILLSYAFLIPAFRQDDARRYKSYFGYALLSAVLLVSVTQLVWHFQYSPSGARFETSWLNTVFVALYMVIILVPIIYLSMCRRKVRYKSSIIIAFSMYLIIPILEMINIIFYGNTFSHLSVASTPFPFFSILLFTLVVYLRLLDKAKLMDQLKVSEKKYAEAKEVSKLKDEFVSVVSHELRTPLTSMKLYTSLLKEQKFGELNEKQKEAVDIMHEETARLSNLVNDILDMSKLESGKAKLVLEEFNVYDELRDNPHYVAAREKGIVINVLSPEYFIVLADRQKFRQLLINLLSNSIKYTDSGGVITIIVRDSQRKKFWEFIINDTGRGIEKKKIPRLFNKFYQAEDSMTRGVSGTGLGLAIVKKIADMHNAKIKVESTVGKGSKFTVVFPR